ncbi:MAG: prolyl oligopeptidase family serine peptidase [Gemmatimonadota bacterium]|jgi:dipeptidyl aminopeptidase/acylaminoacyl peptidase
MRTASRIVPALVLACISLLPAAARSQVPARNNAGFTIDDVLDTRNVSIADLSDDGQWVVITTTTLRDRVGVDNSRYGDPTYIGPGVAEISIVDTRTGERRLLFEDKRQARGFSWSPDGTRLAFLLRDGDTYRLSIWERARNRVRTISPPDGRIVAAGTGLQWTADGRSLLLALQTEDWFEMARERFRHETEGPIVVRSSEDPFLSWEAIRRLGNIQIPALYHFDGGRFQELRPEAMADGFALTGDGALLRYNEDITEKTDYTEIFGRENRVMVQTVAGGEPRTVIESTKDISPRWSGDGRTWVYTKDGQLFVAGIDGAEPRKLAGEPPRKPDEEEPADSAARVAERERRAKERFTPVQLSEKGDVLIASNSEGLWFFDTASGSREKFLDAPSGEGTDTLPRWRVTAWSEDGQHVYLSWASRTAWERGIYRYDRGTRQLRELTKDGRMYSGLRLSADGSTIVYGAAPGNHPTELYVADADLQNERALTEAHPGIDAKLGETELIPYLDVDGDELYGVLYYPLHYVRGQRYPTVFIVYETFFDDRYNSTIALLTSNGYAVMQPSVELEQGYPGEAWVKGVTAAANKLIEMGIADPDRLGVHGTSYGGYATNLLVTQTDRFAAAINISGKVDMVSFYFDSPRLGTRNIHAPERSQDRIGATLWEQPQKYIAHSAVINADRVETPLLLMTGHQDPNVPERTTDEMFYALRRLGKRVDWVSYIDGGHGMPRSTVQEIIDYHERILDWYDQWLKKEAGSEKVSENG